MFLPIMALFFWLLSNLFKLNSQRCLFFIVSIRRFIWLGFELPTAKFTLTFFHHNLWLICPFFLAGIWSSNPEIRQSAHSYASSFLSLSPSLSVRTFLTKIVAWPDLTNFNGLFLIWQNVELTLGEFVTLLGWFLVFQMDKYWKVI